MSTLQDITPSDIKRFWSKVDKDGPIHPHQPRLGPCWLWTAGLTESGYGQFSVRLKGYRAHRFAWIITRGRIFDGIDLCHSCDVPRCVNPAHLFPGTDGDNAKDRDRKGRGVIHHGEASGTAKLHDEDIRAIREKAARGQPPKMIAAEYGVSRWTVGSIVRRTAWKHIQ